MSRHSIYGLFAYTFTPEELPKCRYIDHTLSIWDMSSVYILEII